MRYNKNTVIVVTKTFDNGKVEIIGFKLKLTSWFKLKDF